MSYRILLVEDNPKIREGISDYYSGKGSEMVLETAANGLEGLERIKKESFDLVLLDVMLPGLDGFAVMRRIRELGDLPVIFLTAKTREEDRLYGYELGCDDYICKPFLVSELYAKTLAMRRRAQGGRDKGKTDEKILTCGSITIHMKTMKVMVNGEEIELPPKEWRLLATLMGRPGWVYSREQLLDLVWGMECEVTDRVVDNHIKKLRKYLGDGGKQIKTVFSRGYKITE